ncbi:zf-HC2 domain-containing protein [Streptomyces albiflavescens]|nr:zf-HC2 domain-containing protein [Streptomyces albiflavescens]
MFAPSQECGTFRELLAGHALNALTPDESSAVGAHLATCSACRDEHGCLAAVAAHLSLLRDELTSDTYRQPLGRRRPTRDAQAKRLTLSQWVSMKPCVSAR